MSTASERSERAAFSPTFFEEWFPQRAEGSRGNPTKKKVVVYELYGLTDEEIEIVEAAVGE